MANGSSSAMELRVLINILQSGQGLKQLLAQTNELSLALTKLQEQANKGGGDTSALGQVGKDGQAAAAGVDATGKAIANINPQVDTLAATMTRMGNALKFMMGGFLALKSIQFLKNIADTAARTEVLNTVLNIVAVNAGKTEEEVAKVASSIQRLGITAQSSREALTKFLQSGLRLEGAEGLARAARDLAVISGMDTSQTFNRLIVNIQQLDTMGLRFMGVVVSRMEANQKYKQSHKEITGELTRQQMQEALLAEVIDKARTLQGAYEAAMGNVGKQLTSLRRYYEDLRNEIGKHLLPAYSAFIAELSLFLAKMQDLAKVSATNTDWALKFGSAVRWMSRQFFDAVTFIVQHRTALEALTVAYAVFWTVTTINAKWDKITAGWTAITTAMQKHYESLRRVTIATYEYITALEIMQALRGAGGIRDAFDIGKLAVTKGFRDFFEWVGRLGGSLGTLGTRLVTLGRLLPSFARTWQLLTYTFAALGGMFTTIIAGFAGLTAIAVQYTSLGSNLEKHFGVLWEIIQELGLFLMDVFIVAWRGVEKVFKTVLDLVMGLVDWIGRLMQEVERFPGVREAISAWEWLIDILGRARDNIRRTREEYERVWDIDPTNRLERKIVSTTNALMDARDKLSDAEAAAQEAKAAGDNKALKRAEEEYNKAKARVKDLEKLNEEAMDNLRKKNPERAEELRIQAAMNLRRQDFSKIETAANEVAAKMRVRVSEGKVEPTDFIEQAGGLDALIREYEAKVIQTSEAFADLTKQVATTEEEKKDKLEEWTQATHRVEDAWIRSVKKAEELLGTVGAPGTMEEFQKQLGRLRPMAGAVETARFDFLAKQAQIQTEEFLDTIAQKDLARRKALFDESQTQTKNALDSELTLLKTHHDQMAALDQQAYDNGYMALDEYFDRQLARTELQYAQEHKAAVQSIRSIQLEQARGYAKTDVERERLRTQLAAAQDKLKELEATRPGLVSDNELRREERRRQLTLDTKTALAGEAAQIGSVRSQIEQLNLQLEEERKKHAEIDSVENDRLIRLKRLAGEHQIFSKERERAHQVELDTLDVLNGQLNMYKAQRDAEGARDKSLLARGEISELEARRRSNARVQAGLEDNRIQQQLQITRLAEQEREAKKAIADEENLTERRAESDPEHEAEIRAKGVENVAALQRKWTKDITATKEAIIGLDAAYEDLLASTKLYSTEIKDTFVSGFSDALAATTEDFKKAGELWISMAKSIQNAIVKIFTTRIAESIAKNVFDNFSFLDSFLGLGGKKKSGTTGEVRAPASSAEGGLISGPGTGTSDSIPALLSNGEHVMPASKTAQWLPLLEGIRTGRISAFANGGFVQPIATMSIIPRRYASGGMVVSDGGASAVTAGGGMGSMMVSLHPDSLNMTMREWLEQEVVRQYGRR